MQMDREKAFIIKDGYPYSPVYKDVYFSGDGLAESQNVFVRPHNFARRWQPGATFHILETGFGTGLNFLTTLALFRQSSSGFLHYFACEAFPLQPEEIRLALRHAPELQSLLKELLAVYDPRLPGFHSFSLQGGVTLTLLLGDARQLLPELQTIISGARFDAFYLDGFSPDRNPELWNDSIYQELSRLGKRGSTLSTFTVAGHVRRGLTQAGFQLEKLPATGRKKEFLFGTLLDPQLRISRSPWYEISTVPASKEVAIVGAGLAGCLTARSLADRGFRVTLFDSAGAVASGASGNPLGIVMPVLSRKESHFSSLTLQAYLSFLRYFSQHSVFTRGIIQLFYDERSTIRLNEALEWLKKAGAGSIAHAVSQQEIEEWTGVRTNYEGIFFPEACAVDPAALCRSQIDHPLIDFRPRTQISNIQPEATGMILTVDGKRISSQITIVTSGYRLLAPLGWLPVKPFAGQLTYLPDRGLGPRLPICYNGYLLPAHQGFQLCGATYEEGEGNGFDPQKNREIINHLESALPDFKADDSPVIFPGRAAIRAASTDYMPVIGAVPGREDFLRDFAIIQKKALHKISPLPQPPLLPGLYTMTGLGSRGLLYGHLGSRLLTSLICGDILPLERSLVAALNPVRFLYRELRRNISA